MEPRTALAVSLVAAALAVGLVSLDLAYSLTARLETQQDGDWTTVVRSDEDRYEPFRHADCASPELRLTVDNDVFFGQEVDVRVSYWNYSGQREETVLRETWSMERGEVRSHTFTIPVEAFERPDGAQGENQSRLVVDERVHVTASVGDTVHLSTCVTQEGSA